MSRHRMPRGGASSEDDTTAASDDNVTEAVEAADVEAADVETADVETVDVEPAAVEPDAVAPVDEATETTEIPEDAAAESGEEVEWGPLVNTPGIDWGRVVAYGVLPAIALLLVMAAGFLKWQNDSDRTTDLGNDDSAASEAMAAAKASTITMLSYQPDTVDKQLNDARELLTGEFRDSYTSLINDVVIPGATQKQITAVASVPAVASVSAERSRAVVLVFVNQTVVVGQDAPSDTASSVRVTMEKVDDRWLISEFEPV